MFQKLVSFTKKVADLPDKPATNPKSQFDAAPDEVRQYLNNLIDALKSSASGDSGAKNIGVTSISGLTGNDVQTILESINSLTAKKQQPVYNSPVYQNGWADFTTAGYEVLSYFKDEMGFVHIRGMCRNNSPGANAIFILPSGYRPLKTLVRSCIGKNTSGSETLARVDIQSDGQVMLKTNSLGSDFISINLIFDTR